MRVEDIEVPEGMLRAVMDFRPKRADEAWIDYNGHQFAAALLWLSENPIVPSDEQADQLWHHPKTLHGDEHYAKAMARQWQQIMFLKPTPPLPKAVKALMWSESGPGPITQQVLSKEHNEAIAAAYELGLAKAGEER